MLSRRHYLWIDVVKKDKKTGNEMELATQSPW